MRALEEEPSLIPHLAGCPYPQAGATSVLVHSGSGHPQGFVTPVLGQLGGHQPQAELELGPWEC